MGARRCASWMLSTCACAAPGTSPPPSPPEPLPVVMNDGWSCFEEIVDGHPARITLGPYDGSPPLLLGDDLLPADELWWRVQTQVDRYPAGLLREVIDQVVVGTQISTEPARTRPGKLLGLTAYPHRAVFVGAEFMRRGAASRTVHHEMGHVLYQLLADHEVEAWSLLDARDSPAAVEGSTRDSESWAEYVSYLQARPRRLQRFSCAAPGILEKALFVQQHLAALGVTVTQPVDAAACVSTP